MTTAALDPGVTIAEAIRELVDSVRELIGPDTDDPGVLDELSRLVGRARRRINKAKKVEEPPPAEAKASAPATVPAVHRPGVTPAPRPAAVPAVAPPAEPAQPATARPAAITPVPRVTLTIPSPAASRVPRAPAKHQAPRVPWFRRGETILAGLAILLLVGLIHVAMSPWTTASVIQPARNGAAYCIKIGDDNCDGMIVPSESGWKCVPPSGGPLLC